MTATKALWIKDKWSDFESFVESVIYDRDLSVSARLFGLFLRPFSFLFSGIVRLRLFLYSNRLFLRDKPLDCLVIVVGNLTVGGTGKTPVVERFAKELMQKGKKVAILSRGYKSSDEKVDASRTGFLWRKVSRKPKVVSDGQEVLLNSEEAGDEPFMLASNLPGAVVLAHKDRVNAGRYAIKKFGVNVPRGILREPIRHLSRASYVFLTKSEIEPDLELLQTIRRYNQNAEIIRCVHKPKFFREVNGSGVKGLDLLHESFVGVFCGIASPRGFEEIIDRMSGELRFRKRFLDHHRYQSEELDHLFKHAKNSGADIMVTTEKDAVRIPENYKPLLPFYYIRMEIEIIEGFDDFKDAVEDICFADKAFSRARSEEDRLASANT